MIKVIEKIESKADFIYFLNLLSKDFETNPNEWESKTIPEFLGQMASWTEDYSECPDGCIKWDAIDFRILAQMLYMGKIYE